MPRVYKRKTDRGQVCHDVMSEAIRDVLAGRSVRDVADERGISKSTLHRKFTQYSKSDTPDQERFDTDYKKALVFTHEQKTLIANFLIKSSQLFFGLSTQEARRLAYETATINQLRMPESWKEHQSAGIDWLWGFLRRNTILSIRTPEATSIARATAFNKANIENFFNLLESACQKSNASGFTIFNLDETGFTTVQNQNKVIAPRGQKQVGQLTSAERGELVTTCCIVSASGTALPPVFIFPRKNFKAFMLHGAPEGSLGLANPSGWMTTDNFLHVIDHFILHAKPSKTKPCLIIFDNHESHISLTSLEKAKDNFITVLTLPPHTSNKTQPLDRSVFAPMKSYFNGTADSWLLRHPGTPISIYNMAELIGQAWIKAATPANIHSGFLASGIWPFNRNVFSDADYLPSSVTDCPYPQSSSPAAAQSETSDPAIIATHVPSAANAHAPLPGPSSADDVSAPLPEPSSTDNVSAPLPGPSSTDNVSAPLPGPSSTDDVSAPLPGPSSTDNVSAPLPGPSSIEDVSAPLPGPSSTDDVSAPGFTPPQIFHGFPKAQPRKQSNRGRKRGKSMIATSTPEMKNKSVCC